MNTHEFESYKGMIWCGVKLDANSRCGLVASADVHMPSGSGRSVHGISGLCPDCPAETPQQEVDGAATVSKQLAKDAPNQCCSKGRLVKLRECPFCGADAELQPRGDAWIAICSRRFAENNLCVVNGRTRSGLTLERAVEAWNTRTVDPLITQLGEALKLFSRDDSPDGLPCWCDFDGGGEAIPEDYHQEDCVVARAALSAYQEVKP